MQDEIFCKKSEEYCVVFVFIGTLSLLSIDGEGQTYESALFSAQNP